MRRPDGVGSARLLTLIGPGGVGKTRLAMAVAAELAAEFADGVAWVELAPLPDPVLVAPAIARALGLWVRGEREVPVAPLATPAAAEGRPALEGLAGGAAALRETLGVEVAAHLQDGYEQSRSLARAGLDEAAFAQAWEAGRTLPLENTVAATASLARELR